jgi:cysteine dioxygenase
MVCCSLTHVGYGVDLDRIGLHRVGNPSHDKVAVSLHLYTPPFDMCRTYHEGTGKARATACTTFYSVRGKRIHYNE